MANTPRRPRVAAMLWGCMLAVGASQADDRLLADVAPAESEIVVYPAWSDREPCTESELSPVELERLQRFAEDALLRVLESDWLLEDAELTVDHFGKPEVVESRYAPLR